MSAEGISSGWGSTQSENIPSLSERVSPPNNCTKIVKLQIKGWRKISLYAILVVLMAIVFLNIGLTLWIITVLKLTSTGIGNIKMVKGGLQVNGKTFVQDDLIVATINSRPGQPISIKTFKNFTFIVNDEGTTDTLMFVSRNHLDVKSKELRISDQQNRTLLSVNKERVYIGSDSLSLGGEGGITFDDSIQTSKLKADVGEDLCLESPTRSLELRAPESLIVESKAGSVTANAFDDVTLFSMAGRIQLDATHVYIKNMVTAKSVNVQTKSRNRRDIYQLCACSDGKLFLANPNGLCESYDDKLCT